MRQRDTASVDCHRKRVTPENRSMARYRDDDGEDDEDADWDTDGDSGDDSADEPTVPCPYCGQEFLEDSPRCPHCERYISDEDSPPSRRPLWVLATALICLASLLWWLL